MEDLLKAHFGVIAATDFFTVDVLTFGGLPEFDRWREARQRALGAESQLHYHYEFRQIRADGDELVRTGESDGPLLVVQG